MKVYVFGNQDIEEDNLALRVVEKIKNNINGVEFQTVKPNEDLPFIDKKQVVILDTVSGIAKVQVIEGENVDKILLSPRTSAHDFDLGFQIKYLKKLGKLGDIKIIGIPQKEEIDHSSLQSIFKKLVAQDIQGS